eukprot:1187450-Prorocentrum_minimum.AAC.2
MPVSTRPASFEWALGTVLQKNNNWAEACRIWRVDKFRCTCCTKDFQCLLTRIRGHVGGVKGFDVKPCPGPSKRDDEIIRSFETRVEQFKHARERCKTTIEEKQVEATTKKRALLLDAIESLVLASGRAVRRPGALACPVFALSMQ